MAFVVLDTIQRLYVHVKELIIVSIAVPDFLILYLVTITVLHYGQYWIIILVIIKMRLILGI